MTNWIEDAFAREKATAAEKHAALLARESESTVLQCDGTKLFESLLETVARVYRHMHFTVGVVFVAVKGWEQVGTS
jgi:hypothetical protein